MGMAHGALLGVLSRVEERLDGFAVGISTDTTWCALAFLCAAPLRATLAMTAANAGYYAFVALTQPRLPLAAVAGPVERWVVLGVLTGVVFGALGGCFRRGRRVAALPLAFVAISEVAGAAYLP